MTLTKPMYWTINFLTFLALLYLFHYQGRRRLIVSQPAERMELLASKDEADTRFKQFLEATVNRNDST